MCLGRCSHWGKGSGEFTALHPSITGRELPHACTFPELPTLGTFRQSESWQPEGRQPSGRDASAATGRGRTLEVRDSKWEVWAEWGSVCDAGFLCIDASRGPHQGLLCSGPLCPWPFAWTPSFSKIVSASFSPPPSSINRGGTLCISTKLSNALLYPCDTYHSQSCFAYFLSSQ